MTEKLWAKRVTGNAIWLVELYGTLKMVVWYFVEGGVVLKKVACYFEEGGVYFVGGDVVHCSFFCIVEQKLFYNF